MNDPLLRRAQSVVSFANKDILDIGCGSGEISKGIAASARSVIAIDSDASSIRTAKKDFAHPRLEFLRGRAEKLDFPNGRFDITVFIMSFHHVPPQGMSTALNEARRVTKRHGYLIFLEPERNGTMREAAVRFGCGDGDIRAIKAYAYSLILGDKRLKEEAEFFETYTNTYSSVEDFVTQEEPRYGTKQEWEAFLKQYRFRLTAVERLNIFRKK